MRFVIYISFLLLVFSVADAKPIKVDPQRELFFRQLDDAIVYSQKRASVYLNKLQYNPRAGREFEQAQRMVEVKKSLVSHFKKSRALEDSTVRTMLLEIVQKETITEEDLTDLQAYVNEVLGRS